MSDTPKTNGHNDPHRAWSAPPPVTPPLKFPILKRVTAGERTKLPMPGQLDGFVRRAPSVSGLHITLRDPGVIVFLSDAQLEDAGYVRRRRP